MTAKGKRLSLTALAVIALIATLWFALRPQPNGMQLESADAVDSRPDTTTQTALTGELDGAVTDAVESPRTHVSQESDVSSSRLAKPDDRLAFRGRVVDAKTGEPVGSAIAVRGVLRATTGSDGRFATDKSLPADFDSIAFFSPALKTHIRTVPRSNLEWLDDEQGWLAKIEIGPTFRFHAVGAPADDKNQWRLRVVESVPDQRENAWAWIDVVDGDPRWARYDNPQPAPTNETKARIEVENSNGTWRGSAEISTTAGIHPGVLLVQFKSEFGGVAGRVLDDRGRPRDKTSVWAIPRSEITSADAQLWSSRTDRDGRYQLRSLPPGAYWIHARPRRGEEPETVIVDVVVGENAAPDIIVPAVAYAGAVKGLLMSESDSRDSAVVRLRAVDGGTVDHFDFVHPGQQAKLSKEQAAKSGAEPIGFFEFQQVPEGEYELSVLSNDGHRWTPSPLRVRPPAQDLEIVRDDAAKDWHPRIDVRDSETGAPISHAWFLLQSLDSWWSGANPVSVLQYGQYRFAEGTRVRWSVYAEGYGLASGTELDFNGNDTVRSASVTLTRGYGARLILRDARGRFAVLEDVMLGLVAAVEHPPVAGAAVYADGELVATSDEAGVVVVSLPHKPSRIEVRATGWAVLCSKYATQGCIDLGQQREIVVWMNRL